MIDTEALRELAEQTGVTIHEGQTLNEAADALDAMRWRKKPPDSEGWWCTVPTGGITYGTAALWKLRDGVLRAGYLRTDDYPVGVYIWLKLPDPEGT